MSGKSSTEARAKTLGVLLRTARIQAGQSRIHCANALGVRTQTIIDFEAGETNISLPQLERLAGFLGVPLGYFWTEPAPCDSIAPVEEPDLAQERMRIRQKLIGAQLRLARTKAGKTQRECAEYLGTYPGNISEYERGMRDIPLVELEKLAVLLDKPFETFLEEVKGQREAQPGAGSGLPDVTGSPAYVAEAAHLSPDLREFISRPVNSLYLHLALKMSQLPAATIREIGEALLEITY